MTQADANYLQNNFSRHVGAVKRRFVLLTKAGCDGGRPRKIQTEHDDAIHGDCEGQQGFGSRRHAEHGTADRDGQVQRGDWSRPASWRRARACIRPSKGARIKYGSGQGSVSRGPFALSGDLVAGFWLINTKSLDEAIDWMKRAPFDGGDEIEIRQVFAAEDFGEALTPELREQEERLRAQAGRSNLPSFRGSRRAEPGIESTQLRVRLRAPE